jgi:hypothetical protein
VMTPLVILEAEAIDLIRAKLCRPEDREVARADDSVIGARPRGPGDRIVDRRTFVSGLAMAGMNVSGIWMDLPELGGKQLQFLREVVPTLRRVGIVWDDRIGAPQLARRRPPRGRRTSASMRCRCTGSQKPTM